MLFVKRHFRGCIILAVVLYIFIGAMAPFAFYRPISEEQANALQISDFFKDSVSGERGAVLETGQSAWDERIRLMAQAKERIILSTFDMREGQSTEDVLSVMLHKADEGVQVQILVDGLSGFLRMEGKPLFYALSTHPNIEIKLYNPITPLLPWRLQGRMHDKYIMIDYQAYVIGGRNSFDYFIGSYEKEHNSLDREVLIYNSHPEQAGSMAKLEAYFNEVWNLPCCKYFHEETELSSHPKVTEARRRLEDRYIYLRENYPGLFEDYDYELVTEPIEGVALVTNPTGIYGKEPIVFYTLTELMKHADTRIDIHTPYIVCNDYMYARLSEVSEGVPDARLVINSVENGDNIVASSDYMRNKAQVLAAGFDVYEYDGGTSSHGKSITIDDSIAIVGSYNFDLRSTYMDTEMMLVVQSKELTSKLQENLDVLERDCRRAIDADNYETPEHLVIEPLSKGRYMVMRLIGFVLKPFRYVI